MYKMPSWTAASTSSPGNCASHPGWLIQEMIISCGKAARLAGMGGKARSGSPASGQRSANKIGQVFQSRKQPRPARMGGSEGSC